MYEQHWSALDKVRPYITDSAGVNVLSYPGSREDFADNLITAGGGCLLQFALRFEGALIDLDLLFSLVDVVRTEDGAVIFYSPESRVLDLKMIRRPPG